MEASDGYGCTKLRSFSASPRRICRAYRGGYGGDGAALAGAREGADRAQSYRDGLSVADVARKHGMSAPQLHAWRRAAREGLLPMPEDDALGLVSMLVSDDRDGGGDARPTGDDLELEVCGVRILVPPAFDADHLGRVIAAIRAAA
jgi:transposase